MSNFMSIECYLSFNDSTYFFSIILNYKNLNLKHLIDNITLNFLFLGNFANMKNIRRTYDPTVDLSIFISNKKILSEVVTIDYN